MEAVRRRSAIEACVPALLLLGGANLKVHVFYILMHSFTPKQATGERGYFPCNRHPLTLFLPNDRSTGSAPPSCGFSSPIEEKVMP